MACFVVPVAEAIVTTIITKAVESKTKKSLSQECAESTALEQNTKISFVRKLKWLNNLLWGGSALLAFEHIWHGEVTPWFPFLTAAGDPASAAEMLHEMATAGVAMAVVVTAFWLALVLVTGAMERKERKIEVAAD